MKTSTTSAVLPCTPDAFWASFLDESYLRALYLDELESRGFAVLEIGDTTRELRIVPKAKIFGLGGLIESSIGKELQSARAKEYAFLTRWFL